MDTQGGREKAKYGEELIKKLYIKLTEEFGKGFSIQNLRRMRQFYLYYQKRSSLMSELSWTLFRINKNRRT